MNTNLDRSLDDRQLHLDDEDLEQVLPVLG
jgi:hypothetical protein